MDTINKVIKKLNKEQGGVVLGYSPEFKPNFHVSRLTTGSLYLDKQLGVNPETNEGGWPVGKIIELYGKESSGKTTLALKTIAEAQKEGKVCMFCDVEQSFDVEHATRLGVDCESLLFAHETLGEQIFEILCDTVGSNEVDLIVVDSIAPMMAKQELEKKLYDSNTLALQAAMMSKGLRKLTYFMKDSKTTIIFINQLRDNPSTYGQEYTPGGRSLKYYASVRVKLNFLASKRIVEKKAIIGQEVDFKVDKNKFGSPFKDGSYILYYDGTYDQYHELFRLGLLEEKIKLKVPYYIIEGIDDSFKGQEALTKALKDNEEYTKHLKSLLGL